VIRRLRGEIIERSTSALVLDVSGVGYEVNVPENVGLSVGMRADLHIYTHVREDTLALFGFLRDVDLSLFELLITVPSVGPVKAMGIMETEAADLAACIRTRDAKRLSTLPGVGKKTAERLIVDLGDKILALGIPEAASPSGRPIAAARTASADLLSALANLGYRPAQAEGLADRAIEKLGTQAPLEDLIREALAQAARR
jgi:Holliday junction DNA helicase RuvA